MHWLVSLVQCLLGWLLEGLVLPPRACWAPVRVWGYGISGRAAGRCAGDPSAGWMTFHSALERFFGPSGFCGRRPGPGPIGGVGGQPRAELWMQRLRLGPFPFVSLSRWHSPGD
jgi:hypothetical protein